ncbi:MAG: hypothetical protein V7K97_03020 [Nostoc sp.]|uniref:hypothetical protein n=1 Tax=Nostoc sp. TaxID=1180 RepID=UPI002FFA454F
MNVQKLIETAKMLVADNQGLLAQEKMQAMSEKTVNLESAIDRFLTSIPPGY